jgi:uncharacterized membrane-anchored protein YhcB (DUF1043 family)
MSLMQAIVSLDTRVPTQHRLSEALGIYTKRLGLFIGVALLNLFLLFLALVAMRSELFPVAISLIIGLLVIQVLIGRSARKIIEKRLSMLQEELSNTNQDFRNLYQQVELNLSALAEGIIKANQPLLEVNQQAAQNMYKLTIDQTKTNELLSNLNHRLERNLDAVLMQKEKSDQQLLELNEKLSESLSQIAKHQDQSNQLLVKLNKSIEQNLNRSIEHHTNQLTSDAPGKEVLSTVVNFARAVVEGIKAGRQMRRARKEEIERRQQSESRAIGVAVQAYSEERWRSAETGRAATRGEDF